jgi:DNA-binding IclR family transcriptional regulator
MEKPLGENAQRVLRLIKADPDLKVIDIARAVGLTTQRVYQIIDTLERRGELRNVI